MRTGCGPSSLSAPSALPTLHTPGDPPGTLPSLSLSRRPFTTSFHFPTRPLTTHHPFLCFFSFFSFFFSFSFFFLLSLFLVYFFVLLLICLICFLILLLILLLTLLPILHMLLGLNGEWV